MIDIYGSENAEDLRRCFLGSIKKSGYQNALVARLGQWGLDELIIIAFPQEALEFYSRRNCAAQDPILRYMLRSNQPFFWKDVCFVGASTEEDERAIDFMETMQEMGVRDGLCIPLPPFFGQRAVLSLSSNRSMDSSPNVGGLALLATVFWERWLAHTKNAYPPKGYQIFKWPTPELTKRQLECLELCKAGFSSPQMGELMGVCENTVQFHISNAMHELGTSNRIHAVARAIEGGILDP